MNKKRVLFMFNNKSFWLLWIYVRGQSFSKSFLFPLKSPKMARNDSVQVGRLLQPDFYNTEKPSGKYHQNWEADFSFSSPGSSDSDSPLKRGTYKPHQTEWDSCPDTTSCCLLDDLKRIPQIKRILGPLEFSSSHAVLIDVRTRSCQTCLCFWILVSSGRLCGIKDVSCPSSGV